MRVIEVSHGVSNACVMCKWRYNGVLVYKVINMTLENVKSVSIDSDHYSKVVETVLSVANNSDYIVHMLRTLADAFEKDGVEDSKAMSRVVRAMRKRPISHSIA